MGSVDGQSRAPVVGKVELVLAAKAVRQIGCAQQRLSGEVLLRGWKTPDRGADAALRCCLTVEALRVEVAGIARMVEAEIAGRQVSVDWLSARERPGDRSGVELARRLAEDGGVAGLCIHPRHASQRHAGKPDYELARSLIESLPVPVVLSGGLRTPELAREAFARTGAAAVALARGSLGNPWLFGQLLGVSVGDPSRDEILAEVDWVLDGAAEHLGDERAARYLRKFYPWYVEQLGADRALQDRLQRAATLDEARMLFHEAS